MGESHFADCGTPYSGECRKCPGERELSAWNIKCFPRSWSVAEKLELRLR